jgi:hypothetical protein
MRKTPQYFEISKSTKKATTRRVADAMVIKKWAQNPFTNHRLSVVKAIAATMT